jgi:uncharacterized protein DUF4154
MPGGEGLSGSGRLWTVANRVSDARLTDDERQERSIRVNDWTGEVEVAAATDPRGRSGLRAQSRRCLRWTLLLSIACFVASSAVLVPGQQAEEYRLKAAFLFHFAQFIDWPSAALPGATSGLVFCVGREDPFHGDLELTLQGKSIAGHPVRILRPQRIQANSGCHVVFIPGKQSGRVREQIAELENVPVLTVGEANDFLQQGGMIRFCMEDRKVRFEINQAAVEKANLKISAKLLLLAKTVVGGGKG